MTAAGAYRQRAQRGPLFHKLGVYMSKLDRWRHKARAALVSALQEHEMETVSAELAAATHRIGELSLEKEPLRSRMERPGPLARSRSSADSSATC